MFDKKKLLELINKTKKKFRKKSLELHSPEILKTDYLSIQKCLNSNYISTYGPYVKKFENEIKKVTKSKYVIAVNSGTSALHISLLSLGIKKGDEVLMPALNFVASANSTVYCGATPHFIESEESTLGADPIKLDNYLKKNTFIKDNCCYNKITKKKISALIAIHVFGHPCKIDELKTVCSKYNLPIVEDAAEGLGSFYKKNHLGTFGEVGILSFNGNKIISTGAGGAILTNSKNLDRFARSLVNVGKMSHKWEYNYNKVGFNYRMPNLNASLGLSQIKFLKKRLNKKRQLFNFYNKILRDYSGFRLLKEPINARSNYWLQTIILNEKIQKNKNKILKIFNENNFQSRPLWQLLSDMKHLKYCPRMKIEKSKKLFNRLINLPSNPKI
jgi:perosamine synthetase